MNGLNINITFDQIKISTKRSVEVTTKIPVTTTTTVEDKEEETTIKETTTKETTTEETINEVSSTEIDLQGASESLSEFVDESVKPCDDFYQFTCGTYIKNNPVKVKEPPKGPILGNETEFYDFVKSILVKKEYLNSTALRKINILLKKCIPLKSREKNTCMVYLYIFGQYFFASAYLNELANNKGFEKKYDNIQVMVDNIINEFALILLHEKDDILDVKTKQNYLTKLGNMKFSRQALRYLYNISKTDECYSNFPLEEYHPLRTIYFNIILGNLFMPKKEKGTRFSCKDFFLKTNFLSSITGINAMYFHAKNSFLIFPKFLKKPFFDINFPDSLKYGSIGFVIGHEIIHGYDRHGINFNYEGKIDRRMTSNTTENKVTNKSDCFIEQYKNVTKIKSFRYIDVNQQISDNGGLKIAHRAFMKYLKENKIREPKIPGFEKYTSEQLFFISFSKTFCISMAESKIVNGTEKPIINPTRYRINTALSNYKPFSKAFKCKRGKKMNPKKKCELWMH